MANDPKALLANGQLNKLHVNPSLYVELGAVTLALALLMLVPAWFRKRLLLGIAMALYGLSIFNLHYWGFGFPFILVGAWYLVRAYRLSEKLKHAKAEQPGAAGRGSAGAQAPAVQALHPAGGTDPAEPSPSRARSSKQAEPDPGPRAGTARPAGPFRSPARSGLRRSCRRRPIGPRPTRVFASVHTLVTRM